MKRILCCALLLLTFAKCNNEKTGKDKINSTRDSSQGSSIVRVVILSEDSSTFESEIMFDTLLKQNEGLAKSYYKNGKLKELGMWHKNRKEGLWIFYDELGNKTSEVNYKNDLQDGTAIFYSDKGIVTEKSSWNNGKLHGPSVAYYDNGKPKRSANFENGKKINEIKYEP